MSEHRVTGAREPVELKLTARGLSLQALAFGDAGKPPLLALHGWMDNAASFTPLASLLDQFYVVAVDLPGHGKSDFRPSGASYFHADYALDVAHAADELGFDSFVLVGHSMGGGVATLVAAAIPEKVRHLVLIDGLGPYSNAAEKTGSQIRRAVVQSLAPRSEPRRYKSYKELLERRAKASPDIDRNALALIVERNAVELADDAGQACWQWSTDPRLKLASPTRLTHEGVIHMLGDIQSPILNLVASTGMMTRFPAFAERRETLSGARTVMIDGHHHFHLDGCVEQVADEIRNFVRDTPPFEVAGDDATDSAD